MRPRNVADKSIHLKIYISFKQAPAATIAHSSTGSSALSSAYLQVRAQQLACTGYSDNDKTNLQVAALGAGQALPISASLQEQIDDVDLVTVSNLEANELILQRVDEELTTAALTSKKSPL